MTKNFLNRVLSAAVICLLFGAAQTFAQSTVAGGINGRVTDQQGAVVANATVTITNIGTNRTVTVNANDDGTFRATNLEPGTYSVETASGGFAASRMERVVVEVGKSTSIDIILSVGTATAEVEVTAEAPVINTNDATNSTNINQTSINELPINGRRASNFVLLTPGVAPDGNFGLISFRGISGLLNNSTVDGGDNNQAFFSEERGRTRISYGISQDAVREFSVNTSNYSAEFGRAAGGVVNTVTKSGTNEFHGSLFYYLRDNEWGARNPLSFPSSNNPNGKPEDVRHQFGGSLGGPIVKDRLFFFFSYDQQKRDFPAVSAPGVSTFFNVTSVPGLTPAQINAGISYLQNLTGIVDRKGDQTIYLPKIDWVINDNHTFSAVFNRMRWDSPAGVQTAAVVNRGRTSFGSDLVSIDTLNLKLNSALSSGMTNEARFQYSRDLEQQIADDPDPSEPTTGLGYAPSASIGGSSGITIGKPNFLNRNAYPDEKRYQFADSVTMNRGDHTLKFGGDFNHVTDVLDSLFSESGVYNYSTLANWLLDFNDPAGRRYTNFQQGFGPSRFEFSTRDYNLFIQDDFRVNQNLTLNFGLRYEYQQMPDPQIPNPLESRTSVFPSDKNNFGPRFGFAYSHGENFDTVIRGGYGIYYGRVTNSAISNAITNTGVAEGQLQFFTLPGASTVTYPNVYPTFPGTAAGGGDIVVFKNGMQNPMIHQADLIFEKQIGTNTVISASALLSLGRNLPYFVDTNLSAPTASTTFSFVNGPFAGTTATFPRITGPRPNSNFGRITEIRDTVESTYMGIVLQANRRLTRGIQFQASYTFSEATDNGQNSQTFTSPNSPLNPFDLSSEKGTSNFDVPHRFVASLVYAPNTLFGVGRDSSMGRAIFGGWTISPIITAQSGFTYTGTTSGNVGGGLAGGPLGAGGSSRLPILEPNSFRAPKLINVDLRVSRRIRFTETMNLELLAEGFNIFNRFHATSVNSRIYVLSGSTFTYDNNFGAITNAGNSNYRERQIQLAARFQF